MSDEIQESETDIGNTMADLAGVGPEMSESRNPVDSVNTDHVQDIKIISDPIPDPNYNFGPTEKILEILPALEAQTFMSDEWKKNRRIKLFNDRHFYAK